MHDLRAATGKRYHGGGPVKVCCPFHVDVTPSLAVYPDHAWCFGGCGHIAADRLLAALAVDGTTLPLFTGEIDKRSGKPKDTPSGFVYAPPSATLVDIWHDTLMRGPRRNRLPWLLDRGLAPETIRDAKIGHDGKYFTIPVLAGSRVIGVKKRRDDAICDPEEPRYVMPFGQPALLYRPKPRQGPVIVCEGELDSLLVSQYGYDGVTTTAGSTHLPNMIRRWGIRGPRLLVAPDADDAGDAAYAAILDTVDPTALRLTWRDGKDITDALSRFPEGRRRNRLDLLVRQAKEAANVLGSTA